MYYYETIYVSIDREVGKEMGSMHMLAYRGIDLGKWFRQRL